MYQSGPVDGEWPHPSFTRTLKKNKLEFVWGFPWAGWVESVTSLLPPNSTASYTVRFSGDVIRAGLNALPNALNGRTRTWVIFFSNCKVYKGLCLHKPQYLSVVNIQNNSFRVLCRQSLRMSFETVMAECLKRVLFSVNWFISSWRAIGQPFPKFMPWNPNSMVKVSYSWKIWRMLLYPCLLGSLLQPLKFWCLVYKRADEFSVFSPYLAWALELSLSQGQLPLSYCIISVPRIHFNKFKNIPFGEGLHYPLVPSFLILCVQLWFGKGYVHACQELDGDYRNNWVIQEITWLWDSNHIVIGRGSESLVTYKSKDNPLLVSGSFNFHPPEYKTQSGYGLWESTRPIADHLCFHTGASGQGCDGEAEKRGPWVTWHLMKRVPGTQNWMDFGQCRMERSPFGMCVKSS